MSRQEWVKGLLKSIDEMDAEKFCGYLTENASFKFGNADAVIGRKNIKDAVAGFFTTINGMKHTISDIVESGQSLVCRGDVTYAKKDGSEVSVPFVNFFKMDGDLVSDYQIYIDISPLFAN